MSSKSPLQFSAILLLAQFISSGVIAQIKSGSYSGDLQIAFNPTNNKVSGYYESFTGYDEELKAPRFSCIFFFEGYYTDRSFAIKSYYPLEPGGDTIDGIIYSKNAEQFEMKLHEEPGGCWNVAHFADTLEKFDLSEKSNWVAIRYVLTNGASCFNEADGKGKIIRELKLATIVYVDEIKDNWCHIHFFEKKPFSVWVQNKDLNGL